MSEKPKSQASGNSANPYASPASPEPAAQSTGMSSHMAKQKRDQTGCAVVFFLLNSLFSLMLGVLFWSNQDRAIQIVACVFWIFSASFLVIAAVQLFNVAFTKKPD